MGCMVHGVTKSQHDWASFTFTMSQETDTSYPLLRARMIKNLPATQETQFWSLGQEDPLKKEMVTPASILAGRILQTEEPGRLQSIGLQIVGHKWATNNNTTLQTALQRKLLFYCYCSYYYPLAMNTSFSLTCILWKSIALYYTPWSASHFLYAFAFCFTLVPLGLAISPRFLKWPYSVLTCLELA